MSESYVSMDHEKNGSAKHQLANFPNDQHGATVSFHNICYEVTEGRRCLCWKRPKTKGILFDLNGVMKPGLNAIMGSTGSGKSSFLDVLSARKDPTGLTGEVLIDGAPMPPNFKCLSGYVVQDDVVMGTLTVRENLCFSAALRLPESIPQEEKEQKVNKLIEELGLTRVADSRVGTPFIRGISGGERKRTNIGMEMVIDPPVLFLDEPTTGLDSSTANSVLMLLRKMASHGRTIILSIHQPRYSIYRLFDSLTLLTHGKLVYHGEAHTALDYFSNIGYTCDPHNNPPDFFLDIINGLATNMNMDSEDILIINTSGVEEKLYEEYITSVIYKETKAELERIIEGKEMISSPAFRTITYNTSFFTQFRWVSKRTFRNLVLNPHSSLAQLGVTLFLSVIVGAIFFDIKDDLTGIQNRVGALFFIIVNQCFTSSSSSELFISQRKLFIHEYISGYYRVSVYFLPKILFEIVIMRAIPAIIFSCITYFMIGLKRSPENFFFFMFTVMLVAYTSTSMVVAIATGHSVVSVAHIYITICFVFMMIFAGLLVNLPSVVNWLAWLKYFSIPRYGFSALLSNEFTGLNFCQGLNSSEGQICTGEDFLIQQGMDNSFWGVLQNHIALIIMTISFLIISYIKLRLIKKFT